MLEGLGSIGNIVAVVGVAGLDKFERDLQSMSRAVDGQAQFLNKSLNAAAMAGALVFASSVSAAAEFESSFTGVTKTIDGISDDFGRLNTDGEALAQRFRAMALEIPISVNELNKIAEMGGALGVAKEDIEGFTRAIANLGTTTDLTTEAGATSIAQFINITKQVAPAGMSMAEQTERIASTLVDLGNKTAATEGQIAAFALRISGAGTQVGMSQAEIMALGASLASVGIEAEMGGTAISKMIAKMAKDVASGGGNIETFAKVAGVSMADFSKLFKEDAAGALNLFFTGLNKQQQAGESLYPVLTELGIKEVRLADTILRSAGAADLFNESLNTGRKAYEDNTAMTIEAQKRYATFESQLQLVKAQFNDVFITLGQQFLPVLKDMLSAVNNNKEAFEIIVGTLGGLALTLGTVAVAYKTYKTAVEFARLAQVALNTASAATGVALGPVVAIISGLGIAYMALKSAIDASQSSALIEIESTSDQITKAERLANTIDILKDKKKLTKDETLKLNDSENEFNKMLGTVGLSLQSYGGNLDTIIGKYKELREQKLIDELDELTKNIGETGGILSGIAGGLALFSPALAGAFSDASVGRAGDLADRIKAIKNEIAELNKPESIKATNTNITNLGNSIAGGGGSEGSGVVNKLEELDKLVIKSTNSFHDHALKTLETNVELEKIPELANKSKEPLNNLYTGLSLSLDYLETKNPHLANVGKHIWDISYQIGQGKVNMQSLGGLFNSIGTAAGGANTKLGSFMGFVGSVAASGFNPISMAISGLSLIFGELGDKKAMQVTTWEGVVGALGNTGTAMRDLNDAIDLVNKSLSIDILDSMAKQQEMLSMTIATKTEELNKASKEGSPEAARLRSEIEKLLKEYSALSQKALEYTEAFEMEKEYNDTIKSIDALTNKYKELTEKFGATANFDGLIELLQKSIQESTGLMNSLDPTSKAFEELNTKIGAARALLQGLVSDVGVVNNTPINLPMTEVMINQAINNSQLPQFASGGYVNRDQVARLHGNEFVLNAQAVSAVGRDKLEAINIDPAALARIDSSRASSGTVQSIKSGQTLNVQVHQATPETYVEITDKAIHPRILQRSRKYEVGVNPYAE